MNLNNISVKKDIEIKGKSKLVDVTNLNKEGNLFQSCFKCNTERVFTIYEKNILVCSICKHENSI